MSRIWIPKFKIVEPKAEIAVPMTMSGRYKCRVRKRDGVTVRTETPWFENLILDNGLNLIGTKNEMVRVFAVGSGNSTPAEGQSALDSLVASTSSDVNSRSFPSASPYSMSKTMIGNFGQGAAQGNLAEIGIGDSTTNLFSRALIVDGAGNPTTLTVQADEFLDVFYKWTLNIPETDVTGTIDISGTSHDYTLRAANVTSSGFWSPGGAISHFDPLMRGGFASVGFSGAAAFDGAIGAIDQGPSGSIDGPGSSPSQVGSYVAGSFEQDGEVQWGLTDANFATGIRSVRFRFGDDGDDAANGFQVEYDPVIDKGDTEVLTLQFRHIWGRELSST